WLPAHRWLVNAGMVLYLTLYAASALGALFFGTTLNALLVRALYLRLGGTRRRHAVERAPAHPGRFVWGAEAAFLAIALVQATLAVIS
ncbi:hypothetical protein, partial [Acinetobacter variabilis]|uniref:hypothetical protein n=1 Tax=Acinetobacter variabilis TaxID=70346 RepID=UPI0030FABF79